jgi:hypothetical protein
MVSRQTSAVVTRDKQADSGPYGYERILMRRLHVRGRGTSCPDLGAITVRRASPADADALTDLAEMDSVRVPPGPLLVAEVGDDLRAALSLSDGTAVSDPFHQSAELVALLRDRATELAG